MALTGSALSRSRSVAVRRQVIIKVHMKYSTGAHGGMLQETLKFRK